jgi:hypothetical protein
MMNLRSTLRAKFVSKALSSEGWIRRNLLLDGVTIGIIAFLVVLTIAVFAVNQVSSGCESVCQKQTYYGIP